MSHHPLKTFFALCRGRYLFLLVALLVFFVLAPFTATFHLRTVQLMLSAYLIIILLAVANSLIRNKRMLPVSVILGASSFILGIFSSLQGNQTLFILVLIIDVLFFLFIAAVILAHVLRSEKVTRDLILGAICAYLLVGFAWSFIYGLLMVLNPGSFTVPDAVRVGAQAVPSFLDVPFYTFIYFSFTTLTTLGYGDISPLTPIAQSLSTLEAIVGQLYIAVLIARLVGSYISIRQYQKTPIE